MKTPLVSFAYLLFSVLLVNPLIGQEEIEVFEIEEGLDVISGLGYEQELDNFSILKVTNFPNAYTAFENKANTPFNMSLPLDASQTITLNLVAQNIYGDNFRVIEKKGTTVTEIPYTKPLHFIGTVVGQPQSLVSFSVVQDKLMGVVSFGGQNFNIEHVSTRALNQNYILYKEADVKSQQVFNCDTDTNQEGPPIPEGGFQNGLQGKPRSAAGDIAIYFECDYEMYKTNGNSTSNTVTYTTNLFNMVKGLYAMSPTNVSIVISEIVVNAAPDVYDAANASGTLELLNTFSCEYRNGYNGRMAHLLTTASVGGGIANRPTCPGGGTYSSPLYGVSGSLHNTFDANLSNYSWDINVVAHELGHNFSANHTHDCVWNGNNTPIDCCGNNAGYGSCGCSAGVPTDGTIMSYCHITNNNTNGNPGIDLSQGFHTQVAAKINDFAMNCLSAEEVISCPVPGFNEISATNVTSTTATLGCSITNGVSHYAYYYTDGNTGICYSNCAGIPSNSINISGLQPSTLYYYEISLYCPSSGWGPWSCTGSFTTPPVGGGGNDECIVDRTVTAGVAADTYRASQTITTSGLVEVTGNATFLAGTSITLNENFHAHNNSTFLAKIDNCTPALVNDETKEVAFLDESNTINIKGNQSDLIANPKDLPKNSLVQFDIMPNPLSAETTFQIELAASSNVSMKIFDLSGREVAEVFENRLLEKGINKITYHTQNLKAGMFHAVLKPDGQPLITKKMVVLK